MQMTQLTSASLPGNLWKGVYPSLASWWESGLPHPESLSTLAKIGPQPISHKTCSAWWPGCTHFCNQTHCRLFCTPSEPVWTIGLLKPSAQWWKSNTALHHPSYPRTERRLLCPNILIMNLKSVAVVVLQSKGLTGGVVETERGRARQRVSKREGWGKTRDCSFSLLIWVLTPTGCSSIKDLGRKWANPVKLEVGNRLRGLLRNPPFLSLPPSLPSLILFWTAQHTHTSSLWSLINEHCWTSFRKS